MQKRVGLILSLLLIANLQAREYSSTAFGTLQQLSSTKKLDEKKRLFHEAKRSFNRGDYEEAFALFDKLLIVDPNNNVAHLEYARTLYKLGLFKASKKEFEKILLKNPPPIVKQNIQRYMDKIDSHIDSSNKRDFYHVIVEFGATYDTNIGLDTNKKFTHYASYDLINDTNITKGVYETFNLIVTHSYKADDFRWENSLYSYNEFQNKDIEGLNFLTLQSTLIKNLNNSKILLPLSISHAWIEHNSYSSTLSFTPTISFGNKEKKSSFDMGVEIKKSLIDKEKQRDFHSYGSFLSYLYNYEKLTLYNTINAQKDIRESRVRYDISKLRLRVSSQLFYQLNSSRQISFAYSHGDDKYTILDHNLGYRRRDKKDIFNLFFREQLNDKISAKIDYTKIRNNSNINSYYYDKNSYSLLFSYKIY